MNTELHELSCPICNSPLSVNEEWIITCNECNTKLSIIRHNGRIVSVRQYIYPPSYYLTNDLSQIIINLANKNLSPERWGFNKHIRLPNNHERGTVIYDSEFCRIKIVLESSDYFPLHDTKIFYGRLHAPDNEHSITWNGKNCRCWHHNILGLTLPFIEGMPPQQLAENTKEIWDALTEKLNVNHPSSDMVEYPFRLHAKIWERYKEKLFSIFDLRYPELWEEYSKYSNEYNEEFDKRLGFSRKIEMIC